MRKSIRQCARRTARAVAPLLFASACSGGSAQDASVHSDSAGIDLVHYTAAEKPLAWQFEERFTLGGKETENESFYRLGAGMVSTDRRGNIHVLDNDASRILVFDSTGNFLRSVGASGEGPGEFRMALSMAVTTEGVIGAFDLGKRKIVRWGQGGEILEEMAAPTNYFGGPMQLETDAVTVPVQSGDSTSITRALVRSSSSGLAELVTQTGERGKAIQLNSCGMGFTGMQPIFVALLTWGSAGQRIVTALSAEYELRIYDAGSLVRIIRHNVTPVAATRELALRELGPGMTVRTAAGPVTCSADEVVEKRGFASVIPAVARLMVDPAGRIWVERGHVRGDPAPIDVFSEIGDYIGTLPAGSPYPVAFLSQARMASVATDEMDVSRLVIHDISGMNNP